MKILSGVDVGSKRCPTGLCVVQEDIRIPRLMPEQPMPDDLQMLLTMCDPETRRRLEEEYLERHGVEGDRQVHFVARHLETLPPGTAYPQIVERVVQLVEGVEEWRDGGLTIYLNLTGKGRPVFDLLRPRVWSAYLLSVYLTHGDRRTKEERLVTLGKAFLVTRLQTLLQCGYLHLPRTAEAETLARELQEYEIKVEPDANERYGAFTVGTRDELVTALGLAVQVDPEHWSI